MSLDGKVYTVTGGASGIGLATAKLIRERGGIVGIADVDDAALKEAESYFAAKYRSDSFSVSRVDVVNTDQVESWVGDIKARFGRLDGAANIAGITGKDHGLKSVTELDDNEWNKIIGVNLTGTMYCLRAELKAIEDGGSIVNMASIHATNGTRFSTVFVGIARTNRSVKVWPTMRHTQQASTASLALPVPPPRRTEHEKSGSTPWLRVLFTLQ